MATESVQDKDLDPDVQSAFASLEEALHAVIKKDKEDLEKGAQKIMDRRSLWQEGTCDEDQVEKFRQACQKLEDDCWAAREALLSHYNTLLKQYSQVAKKLASVNSETFKPILEALKPIGEKIAERQKQTHWEGAGAEEYMKQLPMQAAAVTEFGSFVQVAAAGVMTPAQLQQAVFLSLVSTLKEATSTIQSYVGQDTGDRYMVRTAWATSMMNDVDTYLNVSLAGGEDMWKQPLASHIRTMTSVDVTTSKVFAGDKWPNATKDTDVSKIPQPTTRNVGLPPGASDLNSKTGDMDKGDPAGVNQADYGK